MSIIEKSISKISPQWAYKREAWRRGIRAMYDSASVGRDNYKWNPDINFRENILSVERKKIIARARDMERNSDICNSILSAFDRHVIGKGMKLQSKIENEDTALLIESLWKEYSKAVNCDISGNFSINEQISILLRRLLVDGEIFAIKTYTKNKKFPFRIQIRSTDELSELITEYNGNSVLAGIEVDALKRPIAYHFKKYDDNATISSETVRIAADNVLALKNANMPNQLHGISCLATVLSRIKDVNEFITAISMKERVLACLSIFIKKELPNTGKTGRGMPGITIDPATDYSTMSLAPGMIGELNPGDSLETVIPSGQASNAKEFIVALIRLIASGIGLSYEVVARDLSQVNYSSARQGLLEDKATFKKMQNIIIEKFLEPVFIEFVKSMVLSGRLAIPDFEVNQDKYIKHVFIPPGMAWIDPKKEADANSIALESNQDTLERICAEKGEDYKDVLVQRAKEKELIKNLLGGYDVA